MTFAYLFPPVREGNVRKYNTLNNRNDKEANHPTSKQTNNKRGVRGGVVAEENGEGKKERKKKRGKG